ncbi:MAG: hypothetical protein ACKV2Q_25290 [Planctomycetaceae bacterium]
MTTGSNWPIAGEYSNMLQNPQIAFGKPELQHLQTCKIELNQNQQPRPRSGAFATVYKGTTTDGADVALRVFTRASGTEQRERYSAISDYLDSLNGSRPSCLVGFKFFEKGIRVATKGGKWFPLLTMDWVPGDTLFDWIRGTCQSRNARALGSASEKWVELVSDLTRVQIAHGDLQHGNVMVTPSNELKLVDYDCMCVPDLVGRRNLEIGVEPYQHPQRDETTLLYPGLDNFSALYILVVMRALTADQQLWFGYNERPNEELYDKLLFRKEDFDAPDESALFKDLRRSSDEKVRKWAEELFGLYRVPIKDVPPLDQFVNDFEKVRELLSLKAFDEALALLNRQAPPPDIQAQVQEAQQRVAQRQRLEQAVSSGDEAAMKSLYEPRLLDDYPKAKPAVEAARKSAQVIPVLDQLRQLRQANRGRELVQAWDSHQKLLANRKSAQAFARDVETWRQRNAACDVVLSDLRQPNVDANVLKAHWQQLQDLGGHPDADGQLPVVQNLIARYTAFEAFQKVPRAQSAANDQALIAAWKEPLFQGWDVAEQQRHRITAAESRRRLWQTARNVLAKHSARPSVAGEQAIVTAGQDFLDGYDPQIKTRVELAERRLRAVRKLDQICRQPAVSESLLLQAWQEVCQEQADALVEPAVRERAELAVPRAALLQTLKSISLTGSPNERDAQLLPIWDDSLLGDCVEAQPWRVAWEEGCQRRVLLQRLEAAFAKDDLAAMVDCCNSPILASWQFTPLEADRITKARRAVAETRGLLDAIKNNQRRRFTELYNSRAIRDSAAQFAPFQTVLREWIVTEVLPREKNGLNPPTVGTPIRTAPGSTSAQLRWNWPAARFSNACLLKVCRSRPAEDVPPDEVPAIQTLTVQRTAYESGGGQVALPLRPNAQNGMVIVWAIVDLGDEKFYSEPLVLGRLGQTN